MKKLLLGLAISVGLLGATTAFIPNAYAYEKEKSFIPNVLPVPMLDSWSLTADSLFDKADSLGHSFPIGYKIMANNLIILAIQEHQWYNKDVFYGYCVQDTVQANIDWRHPFTRHLITEKYYSGAFNDSVGYKGNGAGSATTGFRLKLNYNPGDGAVTYNFGQDNNGTGVFCAYDVDETKCEISSLNASSVGIEISSLSGSRSISSKDNCGTARTAANYTNKGLVTILRSASTTWESRRQGYDLGIVNTDASNSVVNQSIYEFCRNVNGTKTLFSSKTHSYFVAGSSCDFAKFNYIVEATLLYPLHISSSTRYILVGNSWTSNGTWVKKFMSNNGYNYDLLVRGISGKTTPQLLADMPTSVWNKQKYYLTREVFYFQEYTNDFVALSSNWVTAYAHTTEFLDSANNYFPTAEFVLGEMPPRNSASIDTTKRQHYTNDTAWNTLNGHIRLHARADGWTRTVPVGKNSVIGFTGCELNTAEYLIDKIHLVTTAAHGYNRYGDLVTDSIR